jgi:hypothetical protein
MMLSETLSERDHELIEAIARELRLHAAKILDRCRDERHEYIVARDRLRVIERRDRLRKIENTCLQAAKAISKAPQEDDGWLKGEFDRGKSGRRFQLNVGATGLAEVLWSVSQLAGRAATQLRLPKARSVPDKDAIALYACDLMVDFSDLPPSASANGRYLTVASLLFEFFTGKPEVSLEASCKKVLKQRAGHIEKLKAAGT